MNIRPFFKGSKSSRLLKSCQCTQAQLESDIFQAWVVRIHEGKMHMHRKVWEYCYIAQSLHERDMLCPGRKGLGFAVGQEPLSALFASYGCKVVATDQFTEQAEKTGWVETNQHAAGLDILNKRGICSDNDFRQRVFFRFVDMKHMPKDLGEFDFIWSTCSLEHLGSLELGERFIYESLRYVKPGGVAVHTTEFNVSSNTTTIEQGPTVLYRKRDIERIGRQLKSQGHEIELDFSSGNRPADKIVDKPPYKHEVHLKLESHGYVATSFGLIIRKSI